SDSPTLPSIGTVPPQIEMRSICLVLFLYLPIAVQVNSLRNRGYWAVGSGLCFDGRRLERFVPAHQQPAPITTLQHYGITQGKDHGLLSLTTPFKPTVVELHREPRDISMLPDMNVPNGDIQAVGRIELLLHCFGDLVPAYV